MKLADKLGNVLVTGGAGFVGRRLVEMLVDQHVCCSVLGRNSYPELEKLGVQSIICDIADRDGVNKHLQGFKTVFHVAAKAGVWGDWEEYLKTNVIGTENIINACRKNNVSQLIYTSTPSVVFNGEDIEYGDERMPYPDKFLCNYAKSKVLSEKRVLDAAKAGLRACCIRPHLVWGPGDPHLIPRLIERGRKKQLKIVGEGKNQVDISYIDNVAHAHILAAINLASNGQANGKAYFIGDENPVVLWKWINDLFGCLDIKKVEKKVPFRVAYAVGFALEKIYTLFKIVDEPKMTRFIAEQLSKSHFFSHESAQKDFNYVPVVSQAEGMKKLLKWIKNEKI